MKSDEVIQRIRSVVGVRTDCTAVIADLEASLVDLRVIRAFCDASEADIARRIAAASPFPESAIADVSRESLGSATKTIERSRTLESVPHLAGALDEAAVTAGHIDAVTRAARRLDPDQRENLYERVDDMVDVAAHATVEQFTRRIRTEVNRISIDDGMSRLARQRRATSLSTWTDTDGMWNVRGRFDPVTALSVSTALERASEALFAESVPDTCPSDPIEKQKHLRALAFARLAEGTAGTGRSGRPEFVAVVDLTGEPRTTGRSVGTGDRRGGDSRDGHDPGGSVVTWPIPIEVPVPVLAEMIEAADVHTVVVRNGIVLHAPGNLDLGRTTRLANRAQRRALRGLYSTCAIPACSVTYDRCKLHHIRWWRNGGRTDLDNLIPVCSHHHHEIHDAGWTVALDPGRRLTITFPDGTVRNTGPPHRRVA